jgi:hypothetical protein
MVQMHVEGHTGFLAQNQSGIQNIFMVRRALALYREFRGTPPPLILSGDDFLPPSEFEAGFQPSTEVPLWIDLGPNNDGHSKLGASGNYHLCTQKD